MTPPRPAAQIVIEDDVTEQMNELRDRDPWAFRAMRAELLTLARYPERGEEKRGPLLGYLSWKFKAHAKNNLPSGRIIYRWDGLVIQLIAVSDRHDNAYRAARSRLTKEH